MNNRDYIEKFLSTSFARIGCFVGRYPQWFIAAFLLITVVLGSGFLRISMVKDNEYLYSPINARSKVEREFIESTFPFDETNKADLSRYTRLETFGMVIAVPKRKESFMNETVMSDLMTLDRIVRNISIFRNSSFFRYQDLCPKDKRNKCPKNFLLYLKKKIQRFKQGKDFIRYPVERSLQELTITAENIGGAVTNQSGYVQDFKAVRLIYFLDYGSIEKDQLVLLWQKAFEDTILDVNLPNIQCFVFTNRKANEDGNKNSEMSILLLMISGVVMITFAVISCSKVDCITSKPWVGVAAYLNPLFATIAAFGLLIHCKVEYVDLNIVVAFLAIGIGVDDSFVILAAWRRTNRTDSVEKRMSEALSYAALPVTMTSMTNILSFSLGLMTPYRIIHIISIYSTVSVLLDYIYQIFFFGGMLALDGYREKHNLHAIFCGPVRLNTTTEKKSPEKQSHSKIVSSIFNNLNTFLEKKIFKVIIIAIMVLSLAGAIYNIKGMKQGLDFHEIFPYSSPSSKFLNKHYEYYTDYPGTVQVVFNQTLDYSNVSIQNDTENILKKYESAPHMSGSSYTECWLRSYLSYIGDSRINYMIRDFNVSDPQEFLQGLKLVFLKFELGSRFRSDIVWNENGTEIVASRCFVTNRNVRNGNDEKDMLNGLRQVAVESKFNVFAFNYWFVLYEQNLNLPIIYLKSIGIAILSVSFIVLFVTCDIFHSVSVTFIVICIQIQTLGYISMWNVGLNNAIVLFLLMSVGLCIDYCIHVGYAYKECEDEDPTDKIKSTLKKVGYPVLQGCLSTILGIFPILFGQSYMFPKFFKVIFIVMLFSVFSGLFVLPIILNCGESIRIRCRKTIKLNINNK